MLEDRLNRLWDVEDLPPRRSFDPDDDRQLNQVGLHLLRVYWRYHDMEAFAALCAVLRPTLLDEARTEFGPAAPDTELRRAADGFLAALFGADPAELPCVLHLRSFARSWIQNSHAPSTPRSSDRLGFLAGVE